MNHNFKDMTGQRFGRLTVKEYSHIGNGGKAYWLCVCDCGNETTVSGDKLRQGWTKSCGCLQREHLGDYRRTHGKTDTKIYIIWTNMRSRCQYKKNSMYYNYGGRGISVCEEWQRFEPFYEWAIANGYKEGLSLERIDVDGNYEPSNCKWIPLKDQSLNQRRSHLITAFGKTQTIKEWADESGIKYDTIERRINQYGWSAERAVSVLPHHRG